VEEVSMRTGGGGGGSSSGGVPTRAGLSPDESDEEDSLSPRSLATSGSELSMTSSIANLSLRRPAISEAPGGWVVGKGGRHRLASADTSSVGPIIKDRVKPKLDKMAVRRKLFRPRASVMYGDSYETQKILPGDKDPQNWILQDKKLGYQKSRMWFPVANIGAHEVSMLPKVRKANNLQSDQVVQEFLQMKALLSYVGDIVSYPAKSSINKVAKGCAKMDSSLYDTALRDVARYWEPLVGATLPAWAKPKVLKSEAERAREFGDTPYVAHLNIPGSSSSPVKRPAAEQLQATKAIERQVMWTKGVLRKLLKRELHSKAKTGATLRGSLDFLVATSAASMSQRQVRDVQGGFVSSIEAERRDAEASLQGIETLMKETVKLQYASLPPRYILVLEKRFSHVNKLFCST